MNKAVLISIQPKWCELIASGKKTIEVRKTAPKLETPVKCYIYCTKGKEHFITVFHKGEKVFCDDDSSPIFDKTIIVKSPTYFLNNPFWRQKVIGEFMCDKIEPIACHKYGNGVGFDYLYYTESLDTLTKETQLSDYDMQQYLGCAEDGECVGYAWHITDLKIYDNPKKLCEFTIRKKCNSCKRSGYESTACVYDENCIVPAIITRPPQSYCYVEELQ